MIGRDERFVLLRGELIADVADKLKHNVPLLITGAHKSGKRQLIRAARERTNPPNKEWISIDVPLSGAPETLREHVSPGRRFQPDDLAVLMRITLDPLVRRWPYDVSKHDGKEIQREFDRLLALSSCTALVTVIFGPYWSALPCADEFIRFLLQWTEERGDDHLRLVFVYPCLNANEWLEKHARLARWELNPPYLSLPQYPIQEPCAQELQNYAMQLDIRWSIEECENLLRAFGGNAGLLRDVVNVASLESLSAADLITSEQKRPRLVRRFLDAFWLDVASKGLSREDLKRKNLATHQLWLLDSWGLRDHRPPLIERWIFG